MARVHNFSAGPAALPLEVLVEAQTEFLDLAGSGMSVLEMSHRSPAYQDIIDDAEATLRRILAVPDAYRVLFLQGGATLQFAAVPLNLMRRGRAGYVISGSFSKKAWQEARRYGQADVLASSADTGFDRIPDLSPVERAALEGNLDYIHLCQNNTIFGTTCWRLPETAGVPLVADASSCFLSFPLEVERYGLIYAGAQKNAGPAGVTVVIVREELVGDGPARADICPTYLSYRTQVDAGSMHNTPNTFGIYLSGKVFRWIERAGGLAAMEARNREKARCLYDFLDASRLFTGTADRASRSISNVTFRTGSPELDADVIAGAAARGITGIKGHRLVGGMRASLYNAVDLESVRALVSYLEDFEAALGGRSL